MIVKRQRNTTQMKEHTRNTKMIVKRQRNTTQMKEHTRNTEVLINEEKTAPEKEFIIMIVKMIKNIENKMEKMQESINKDREELKNKHKRQHNY